MKIQYKSLSHLLLEIIFLYNDINYVKIPLSKIKEIFNTDQNFRCTYCYLSIITDKEICNLIKKLRDCDLVQIRQSGLTKTTSHNDCECSVDDIYELTNLGLDTLHIIWNEHNENKSF